MANGYSALPDDGEREGGSGGGGVGVGGGAGGGGGDSASEPSGVIIHEVAPTARAHSWTHIEDLDSFFTRMYRYYLKGGFVPMLVSDLTQLAQYCFVVSFITFLAHCVDYPLLFGRDRHPADLGHGNVTFADLVYPNCASRISNRWWALIAFCAAVGLVKLVRCVYQLYHAYDTKLFYNNALHLDDDDLGWLGWRSVQNRVKDAQRELQMCIRKRQITELDIHHRILRFDNYMVAMVNKRLLPLHVSIPLYGDVPYLSKGLKHNLELLLFYSPWSPWENCWQLRDCYKDASQRLALAGRLRRHISILALLNFVLAPFILAWQILYFFFSHAELIKRSPESLGLRTWSPYARVLLRHFNELDHELTDRLGRAHKPATKYLNSFPAPVATLIAKNVAFFCASVLAVLILLSLYDEIVLTVEHMLTLMTGLGCALAAARSLVPDEESGRGGSEELLVRVLGHVHYLPASWRGRAHTKLVAAHFRQLFQFRATHLLMELASPLVCPFMVLSLRSRALDIVDFYRNFTVSVLDIGDVCSFAQMDVRRHGNPDWAAREAPDERPSRNVAQYDQGEDGKTELSLVAFSCRNPDWRVPLPSQRNYLMALQSSLVAAANDCRSLNPFAHQNNMYKTMLYSHYNQFDDPVARSGVFRSKIFDENDEDENPAVDSRSRLVPDRADCLSREEQDMSASALHLYDLHLARIGNGSLACESRVGDSSQNVIGQRSQTYKSTRTNEDTPLLKKTFP